eukprot:TRINITY_DN31566_c0_g1_i1.p1 TRINITY_DN31566_c0_g1~~TRINITY_DN31566_c0_g1_i1.p1  ORF type:complete len:590 (+),score=104.13 TRINITY_DN31566_c0_g1_i1:61-1770(+)
MSSAFQRVPRSSGCQLAPHMALRAAAAAALLSIACLPGASAGEVHWQGTSFPRLSHESHYPYETILAPSTATCYKKLSKDPNCCLDSKRAPNVRHLVYRRPEAEWHCGKGCYDACPDKETSCLRGADSVWIPKGATCASPRILYIHGGSWMYGSPTTLGYDVLASQLAALTGGVVMVPDYPLVPIGNFTTILKAVGDALSWLAWYGPWKKEDCGGDHPPIVIGGDSSGGGTALSLLLQLKRSPHLFKLLPDSRTGRLVAGAFFFSPWTNLVCNTPDYYHHAFASIVDASTFSNSTTSTVYTGDIIFHGHPDMNSGGFQLNSEEYIGDPSLLTDPLASPMYATATELAGGGLPPLYFAVGASESILGDSVVVAQKAAAYGAEVNLDIYEGMWHVFPMYAEGCGGDVELWPARRALNRTAKHILSVTQTGHPYQRPSGAYPVTHYIYDRSLKFRESWFGPDATDASHVGAFPAPATADAAKPAWDPGEARWASNPAPVAGHPPSSSLIEDASVAPVSADATQPIAVALFAGVFFGAAGVVALQALMTSRRARAPWAAAVATRGVAPLLASS